MGDLNRKLSCAVVQDLLILYDDDACSEETRREVEEHLAECEKCRKHRLTEVISPILQPPVNAEAKAVKRSFRKVHKRWIATVLAILLLFPLIAVCCLGYNEITGQGRCFTNFDEIKAGETFLNLIAEKKYEEASQYADFSPECALLEKCANKTMDEYLEDFFKEMGEVERTINGETWLYSPDTIESLYPELMSEEAEIDWQYLISKDVFSILFPEDFFYQLTGTTADSFTETSDGDFTYTLEKLGPDLVYHRIETQWGRYVMTSTSWKCADCNADHIVDESELIERYFIFDLRPKEVKENILPIMKETYAEAYQKYVSFYRSQLMGDKNVFVTHWQMEYARKLQEFQFRNMSVTDVRYDSACRVGEGWRVFYYVKFQSSGEIHQLRLEFEVKNDKLRLADYSSLEKDDEWIDAFLEILTFPEAVERHDYVKIA